LNNNQLIADGLQNLKEIVTLIKTTAIKQQEYNSKGHTVVKERSRNELENYLYRTALRLRSYARITDNDVLIVKLTYSQSKLNRMRHNDLLSYSRMAVSACEEFLPNLEIYQINRHVLNELSQIIEQTASLTERDTIVDKGVETTASLESFFTLARYRIKILEDFLESYVEDNTFISRYFNFRKIHDPKRKQKTDRK
jgi:hypothetical protein